MFSHCTLLAESEIILNSRKIRIGCAPYKLHGMTGKTSPNMTKESSSVFNKELAIAIESIAKMHNFKQPQQKLCLLWMLEEKDTKLICFRKVKQQLQMSTFKNPKEVNNIIEADSHDDWRKAQIPEQVAAKLLPLLLATEEKKDIFRLRKLWEPHFRFWGRYFESWKNGSNSQVLLKFGEKLASDYPFVFLQRCAEKASSWFNKP